MRSVALAVGILALARPAGATYSITALDTTTGEVGGTGASCVPYEVIRIYGAVAARGALNAQASFDDAALARALELLGLGTSASDTLAEVTDAARFPQAPRMQWGIVDSRGGSAHATGPDAQSWAGDLGASADGGRYVFTVQGNLLSSAAVLDQARTAFQSGGCDLADRLVRALEAAGENGQGDARCTGEGRPADSAYLDVTATTGSRVTLSIPDVSPDDPIVALRREYDAFRRTDPCPASEETPPGNAEAPATTDGGCSLSRAAGGLREHRAPLGAELLFATMLALRAARWRRRVRALRDPRARND